MAKAELRRRVLARRDTLDPAARARASTRIHARLGGLDAVRSARTLLAYAAIGSEVDLDPLLRTTIAAGVGVFLPYVERLSPPDLGIVRVRDLDRELAPGRLGIREPDPGRRRGARVDRLDVVLVPGVAFDARGWRLGHGAGFYDRLLPRLRPATTVIAVAFEAQIVDAVPHEPHDVPIPTIVTERRVIRAREGDRPPPRRDAGT